MPIELSVIVPCFNEAHRIDHFFSLIGNNIELNWEWIFVNDASTDDTGVKISRFRGQFPKKVKLLELEKNFGKGKAVSEGILNSKGNLVGYVDADLAASPLQFQNFMNDKSILQGKEMIIGIRLKTQDGKVKRFLYRHLIGRLFQTYTSILTGISVYDTQCGFKLIEATRAKIIAEKMKCNGFAFDVELIGLALRMNMKVREELIPWEEKGNTSIRPHHIIRMAYDIWIIRCSLNKADKQLSK